MHQCGSRVVLEPGPKGDPLGFIVGLFPKVAAFEETGCTADTRLGRGNIQPVEFF